VPGNINSQFSIGCNLLIREGAVPLIVIDDIVRETGAEICPVNDVINGADEDEKKIIDSVRSRGGASIDEISSDTGLASAAVNSIITVMEIKGFVESYAGRIYAGGGI
jgi:DNA processing protein